MKKTLFLCLLFISVMAVSSCYGVFRARTMEFYASLSDKEINFFQKLKTCSPASLELTKEYVYGKTKNGKCHYSFKEYNKGQLQQFHCMLPMQVSLGYATSSLDLIEATHAKKDDMGSYDEQNQGLVVGMSDGSSYYDNGDHPGEDDASSPIGENNEIIKLLRDYCILKTK